LKVRILDAKVQMKLVNVKPLVLAVLLLAPSIALHFALPNEYRLDFAFSACAVVAFILGFSVATWAVWLFRQKGTPVVPSDHVSFLVTTGPFRFSRNPMYLGVIVMLFAITLWFGSWPMLIPPAGFWGFMSLVRIPYEEQLLQAFFGEAYTAYARNVRRWI
jgi:protein-S-isoprenylcysteine O-methyltransferase Ste14